MFSPEELFLSALFGFIGGVDGREKTWKHWGKKKQPQENDERSSWKGEHLCLNLENEEIN